MEFFHKHTQVKPEKGDLLISEPFLPDPNFERSVVYLCEHDDNGTFGFVLNQKSQVNLDEVIEDVYDTESPVFVGGPVERNTLHYLHRSVGLQEDSKEICNGIMWGGNFESLLYSINSKTIDLGDVKFFVGYSGWSPGQLEEELKANSWIVYKNAGKNLVFDADSKELWKIAMNDLGGKYKMMSNYPSDPRLN